MDDFDRLLALTRAAEGCNGLARQFIDRFGDEPDFSRFLSAPGQPYCQPAASLQAKQHMDDAHRAAEAMREETRRWDQACSIHDAVVRAAVGLRMPVINFNGSTYPTAHEAARYFAQAVSEVLYRVEGYDDIEHSCELARLLADFLPVPDYYGQIQQESMAAEEFVTISEPAVDDGLVTIKEIAELDGLVPGDNQNALVVENRKHTKWDLVRRLLECEPDWDSWNEERRASKAAEWNSLYGATDNWIALSGPIIGARIRDRRKERKAKEGGK